MSYDIVLVSSGYDMIIRFWSDFNSGTNCKYQIEHKDNAINALEMTPAKDKVAFASGNSIKFLDLHKLGPLPVLSIDPHEGLISTILFPQTLKDIVITAGEDCSVRVSDMRVGKVVKPFFHANYVNSVAIGNNNKDIIAADENGTIKIWDMEKGEVRTEYNSNIEEEGLAFRSISLAEKEGFLVGAKSNGNVCIFDYNNNNEGQNLSKPKVFEAHKNGNIQTDNMGKPLLSTDFDLKTRFIGHKKWVWDCDFTLDSNYLLSCSSDKTIKIWNIATGKNYSTFNNPKGVNNIALSD